MDFVAVVDQVIALLRQRGRVTYRTLQLQFTLDDEQLAALKDELLYSQPQVIDDAGRGLVWIGDAGTGTSAPLAPVERPGQAPLNYTPSYLAEKILTSRSALEGERKQVTVLFADLKGSMELLAERDPEEARHLLDPVLDRMMAAVHQYEGTVNQVMGDGIMALFGAPLAHEDHAVRACYAALRMQETIKQYAAEVQRTHGVPLHIRVGLNAGEVVVRSIGSDLHMDYTAVGQATHLAARMEQMAMPGAILITPAVLRLVEGFVQVKALGAMPVRGLRDPVEVYEVTGAGTVRTRLQAAAVHGLSHFVGRQSELETLRNALRQVDMGHGQVVAGIGEPGVGKSRLFTEFIQSSLTEGWRILETSAVSSQHIMPYLPVRDLLMACLQIDDHDDEPTMREKIDKRLTLDIALQPLRPVLLTLLDLTIDDPAWLALDAHQRRLQTIEGIKRLLLRQSQIQPLVLIVENLHWSDPGTQAVLDSLVESLPMARLLLLVNYRPEYQHSWGSKTYYTQIRLDPLPRETAEELLRVLLGDTTELQAVMDLLIERTTGNPLFLEESIRTLVETQTLVGERGAYRLAHALSDMQVPSTVQAILAARIDRLPPEEKHLLQCAAVIGTEVPFPLLQAIADVHEDTLHRGLAHLQAAEFLYETTLFPERLYTFKHVLTQEVAYGSLLQERRCTLHTRVVEAIERAFPGRLAPQIDQLAHHAWRGAMWEKAVVYCRQAGTKAAMGSAYREAVAAFEHALMALQHLPEGPETQQQAFDLRMELRPWLAPLGDYERILANLRAAEGIAEALGDRQRLGLVYAYLTDYFRLTGQSEEAVACGEHALTVATDLGDFSLQIVAQMLLGHACHAIGDYHRAVQLLRHNVTALTGDLVRVRFASAALPSVFSRSWLAFSLADLGAFAEAAAISVDAVRIAEEVDTAHSQVMAAHVVGLVSLCKGDVDKAIPILEQTFQRCQVGHIPLGSRLLASALGYAYALGGRVTEGIPLLEQAVQHSEALRVYFRYALWLTWLGEAYLLAGRAEEAFELAERARGRTTIYTERGHQAYALRLLGDIAAHREPLEITQAEASYQQALALAEELGMRPLQAHCHRGLGTLYAKTGQRQQAQAELSAAIDLYRAMEMTFWLPQTEATRAQMEER
jgi:class 3 adenylate cyclase/tetratricopeptide (TPR) repeat protein